MKKLFALAIVATMSMPLFAAADGAALFKTKCAACHGPDGAKQIPALGVKPVNTPEVKKLGAAGVDGIVTKGQGKMPAFGGKLTAEEITAVSAYVLTLK
jgi:mono/diheme cytochrome c family protein